MLSVDDIGTSTSASLYHPGWPPVEPHLMYSPAAPSNGDSIVDLLVKKLLRGIIPSFPVRTSPAVHDAITGHVHNKNIMQEESD